MTSSILLQLGLNQFNIQVKIDELIYDLKNLKFQSGSWVVLEIVLVIVTCC